METRAGGHAVAFWLLEQRTCFPYLPLQIQLCRELQWMVFAKESCELLVSLEIEIISLEETKSPQTKLSLVDLL